MLSLIWPGQSLGTILAMAQEAMTSADRISEILDTQSTITDGGRAGEAARPPAFENVSFRFSPDSADVLHDINLDLPPVRRSPGGATGTGKTPSPPWSPACTT